MLKDNTLNTLDNIFHKGDSCFLFRSFPLDYKLHNLVENPIKIHENIYLVQTPSILNNTKTKETIATTEWICQGFHLGIGYSHVSIKIDSLEESREKLFWSTIVAFFLVKPLFIHISGQFNYGDPDNNFINNPGKYDLRSNLSFSLSQFNTQPQNWLSYNTQDIENVKRILPSLLDCCNDNINLRQFFNIQMFLQIFFFEKLHFASSLYQKLFPLLDSLAGNPSDFNVSERLGKFLADISFNEGTNRTSETLVKDRLAHIWGLHRYPEVHGHIKENYLKADIANSANIFPDKNNSKDLMDLAEMARVSFLKILLLDESNRKKYDNIPIPPTGKSRSEAKNENKFRDMQAESFFNCEYNNSDILVFYSDLINSE